MIKFSEVTWYSKLATIIFFIGILPALAFYIGIQYQLATNINFLQINNANRINIKTTTSINTTSASSTLVYTQKLTCRDTSHYFAITQPLENTGEAILVKQKKDKDQKFDCVYVVEKNDFELKNETEYFIAIEGNFLITDAGTGPVPRGLGIYSLSSKKSVFQDIYSNPIEIKDESILYWKPTNEAVTKDNCPKLDEYTISGLGAGIESHIKLSLINLTSKDLGEKRCSPRQ